MDDNLIALATNGTPDLRVAFAGYALKAHQKNGMPYSECARGMACRRRWTMCDAAMRVGQRLLASSATRLMCGHPACPTVRLEK